MARKQQQPSGPPEWLVTFADLMSILVCFFVLLISFSIQDKHKLQVVAGSMREAFGIKYVARKAGMIEREGSTGSRICPFGFANDAGHGLRLRDRAA